jgi:hypothetical protein
MLLLLFLFVPNIGLNHYYLFTILIFHYSMMSAKASVISQILSTTTTKRNQPQVSSSCTMPMASTTRTSTKYHLTRMKGTFPSSRSLLHANPNHVDRYKTSRSSSTSFLSSLTTSSPTNLDRSIYEQHRKTLSSLCQMTNSIGSCIIQKEVMDVKKRMFMIMSSQYQDDLSFPTHCNQNNNDKIEKELSLSTFHEEDRYDDDPSRISTKSCKRRKLDPDETMNTIPEIIQFSEEDDNMSTLFSNTVSFYTLTGCSSQPNRRGTIPMDRTTVCLLRQQQQRQRQQQLIILQQEAHRMKRMAQMFRTFVHYQQRLLWELEMVDCYNNNNIDDDEEEE